jgi:hypothetical protein
MLHRNWLRRKKKKKIIEGTIDVTGRQRRCKLILGDCGEMKGFWKLKDGTLDYILWRMHF